MSSEADRHIAHEVAIALHMSKDAAARHIATARSLFEEFAPFGHALLEGSVSDWHARTLIAECANVTDPEIRAEIGRLALHPRVHLHAGDVRHHEVAEDHVEAAIAPQHLEGRH